MEEKRIILGIDVDDGNVFNSYIKSAVSQAEIELLTLDESIESIKSIKPNCDKTDYVLAASSGAICGIIDIFLVGKPGESVLGGITDKWFEKRTCDFAKLCGWKGNDKNPVKSAIGFLERKFKVPYDQRGCGDAGAFIYNLTPSNHHFKSLAHNPSLLGLFFSILDQFTNTSHFISEGKLIELEEADDKFQLRGNSVISKFWCGFVNWFGHLMSDVSGASGSKTRGMGIPSPLWTWTNSVIAIKAKLNLPISKFDKDINEFAIKIFEEGYDTRFQATQVIPVLINEFVVRLFYAIRRLLNYYSHTNKEERSLKTAWKACEPFTNPTVKRMLLVAHSTFCLIDIGEATVIGFATAPGSFNAKEFLMHLNIAGIGRLSCSLYGEAKMRINYRNAELAAQYTQKEKHIVERYIEGLNTLKVLYDDREYFTFVDDLKINNYIEAFGKSVELAKLRNAPVKYESKQSIDDYFNPKQQ